MADFDNGLPPAGTDVTGKSVSSVNITDADAEQTDVRHIGSVNITGADAEQADVRKISGLFVSNEKSGDNQFFMYYL